METMHFNHHSISDEQLCAQVASGDRAAEETLVLRHSRLVRSCARPFFLAGGDSEDLIQEGMLGLLSAIREFRPGGGARFATYARICIRRRIISAVRMASGDKHSPLNSYVSLESSFLLADQDIPADRAYSGGNPEDVLIHQEDLSALESAIKRQLTPLEDRVLTLYLEGSSYAEIAERLQRPAKSVDNAVQRIRRKVARYLSQGETSKC